MDFLRSASEDDRRVILLLLVANGGRTSVLLYAWDTRLPLHTTRALPVSGQALPPEDSFPLMLIPSSRHASFIIVTETNLVVYDGVLDRPVKRVQVALPRQPVTDARNRTRQLLWVQWARALRHPRHQETEENIYLVREDGEIRHYVVKHELRSKIDSHFSPGYLGINVDKALAIIGPYSEGGDILIAGGDGSDGGVFHLPARHDPTRIQVISNWSPMVHLLVIPTAEYRGRHLRRQNEHERIFTCSGRSHQLSFLNELIFGIESQIWYKIEYGDALSTTQIFCLEHPAEEKLLLLLSHPEHTGALTVDLQDVSVERIEAGSCTGLVFEEPTLTASCLRTGHILQITPRWLKITSLHQDVPSLSLDQSLNPFTAAHSHAMTGSFIVAHEVDANFEVRVGTVELDVDSVPRIKYEEIPQSFIAQPTALSLATMHETSLAFVASGTEDLHIFAAAAGNVNWKLMFNEKLSYLVPDYDPITTSSIQVLAPSYSKLGVLLIGTRDGWVFILDFKTDATAGHRAGKSRSSGWPSSLRQKN